MSVINTIVLYFQMFHSRFHEINAPMTTYSRWLPTVKKHKCTALERFYTSTYTIYTSRLCFCSQHH